MNGGAPATLNFPLAGFLPMQRQVPTPWRDYSFVPDVVLTPFDGAVTSIGSNASALQVARGSSVTDESGTRQATVMFPAGTTATMTLPDGSVQEPGHATIQATGEILLQNKGGILTYIGNNGSILVQRGADILLHLLP